MSKPTPPEYSKRTRAVMPISFSTAGKIIALLTPLSLDDAKKALGIVNTMFADREQLADKPAFTTE